LAICCTGLGDNRFLLLEEIFDFEHGTFRKSNLMHSFSDVTHLSEQCLLHLELALQKQFKHLIKFRDPFDFIEQST
jgi:hypothetical protein